MSRIKISCVLNFSNLMWCHSRLESIYWLILGEVAIMFLAPSPLSGKGSTKVTKVGFFGQCSKMQLIPLKNVIIKTRFIQFLWFFRLKCSWKGQIIPRIHLALLNAYKLMCFARNINGNRNDTFFEWDCWSLHWWKNLTLSVNCIHIETNLSKVLFVP